jgi:bidirectional [NiFe] hydrogenase diaphorase subunit
MNRDELQTLAQREIERQQKYRCRLLCCASTPCLSSGTTAAQAALEAALSQTDLKTEVQLVSTGCMGPCSRGPIVTVQTQGQEDVIYEQVTPAVAQEIVERHVLAKEPDPPTQNVLPKDSPFFTKQTKVVLSNSGVIDPERLEDYVAHGGYSARGVGQPAKQPELVRAAIIRLGLGGGGGAG